MDNHLHWKLVLRTLYHLKKLNTKCLIKLNESLKYGSIYTPKSIIAGITTMMMPAATKLRNLFFTKLKLSFNDICSPFASSPACLITIPAKNSVNIQNISITRGILRTKKRTQKLSNAAPTMPGSLKTKSNTSMRIKIAARITVPIIGKLLLLKASFLSASITIFP
jgi:hypothetical protein